MGNKLVKTEILEKQKIGIVKIDNPPVNEMTPQVREELTEIFDSMLDQKEIGALILTAAGERAFCAGISVGDIPEYRPQDSWRMTRRITTMVNTIYNSTVPVIAAINGPAVGVGFCLPTVCDIVISSENAWFSMNEINVGVLGGPNFLLRVLPITKVRKIFFTGERLSAKEAYRLGWVEKVVTQEKLMDAAKNLAVKIAEKSPFAIRLAKLSCMHSELLGRQEAYEWECRWTAELTGHEDSKEGASAFLEKRNPKFRGIKWSLEI